MERDDSTEVVHDAKSLTRCGCTCSEEGLQTPERPVGRDSHGYPDKSDYIRINPDNKLSGNIQIINYPFNYPSTWRLILFMYCFV